MNIFKDNELAINNLYENSLKEFNINKEDCLNQIKYLIKAELENGNIEWSKSIFRKIMDIHQRLRLIDDLVNNKTNPINLKDLELNYSEYLKKTEPIRELNIFRSILYPPLCTYLLITCFDQLGQNKEFVDFNTWTRSSNHVSERETIIKEIDKENSGISKLEFVKILQDKYNEIYGVTKSFRRFIRERLPEEFKENLLDQIKFEVYGKDLKDFKKNGSDKDKEDWLMRVRNSYTHNTYSTQKHYIEGHQEGNRFWELREVFNRSNGKQVCLVYVSGNFFTELQRVIKRGILELIIKNGDRNENGTEQCIPVK